MKATLVILMSLVSQLASAYVGANDGWEKIFSTKSITLLYEANLGGIELKNACLTAQHVKSIKPMKYCPKLIPAKSDWVCEQWITGIYTYPRTMEKNACLQWGHNAEQNYGCLQEGVVSVTVPQTFNVRVVQTHGSYSTYPGFQKAITLPDCRN